MSASVTQRLLNAMQPGTQYSFRQLRAIEGLANVKDNPIRSALFCLQKNARVLKTGRCKPFWYSLNPVQPQVRSIGASRQFALPPATMATLPGVHSWPAVRDPIAFDHAPGHLIAANDSLRMVV